MDDDPRLRDHQPGLRWTVIVSIVGLLVILAINNPTEADARKFVGERLSAAMRGSVTGGSPEERAGAGLAMAILAPMVDSALVVERRDLIIASHYTVKPNAFLEALQTASGNQDTLGEICLIGIFVTVQDFPHVVRVLVQLQNTNSYGMRPTMWSQLLPSVLQLALGLFLALQPGRVASLVARAPRP